MAASRAYPVFLERFASGIPARSTGRTTASTTTRTDNTDYQNECPNNPKEYALSTKKFRQEAFAKSFGGAVRRQYLRDTRSAVAALMKLSEHLSRTSTLWASMSYFRSQPLFATHQTLATMLRLLLTTRTYAQPGLSRRILLLVNSGRIMELEIIARNR